MKLNTIYSYFIIILFSPLIGKLIKNITIYYKSYKEFKKSDLLCDNINNGIIITTGTISDEAKSILNKIEKPYNISIISSKDLAIPYTEYVLNPN